MIAETVCPGCDRPFSAVLTPAGLEMAEQKAFEPGRGLGVFVGSYHTPAECKLWHNYPLLAWYWWRIARGEHAEAAATPGAHGILLDYHHIDGLAEDALTVLEEAVAAVFGVERSVEQVARLAELDAFIAGLDQQLTAEIEARRPS